MMKAAKKVDADLVNVPRGNKISRLDDTMKVYTAKIVAPFYMPTGEFFGGVCLRPGVRFPNSRLQWIDYPSIDSELHR